jgi:hypothetical protein
MINPYKIHSKERNQIIASIAREIISLSLEKHKVIASRLKGVVVERSIVEKLGLILEPTMINMMKTDVIIGKGDLFKQQTTEESALVLIDSLQPEGITEIYLEPENMTALLGSLVKHQKTTALNLFTDKALRFIGICVSPKGVAKSGKEVLKIEIDDSDGKLLLSFKSGEITIVPFRKHETVEITMYPNWLDLGAGQGKKVKRRINCAHSQLGIIVDTRGRPLEQYHQPMKLQSIELSRRNS